MADRTGKADDVNSLVKGLLDTRQLEKDYMLRNDQTYAGMVDKKIKEIIALYNYKYVLEDRSRGIHNGPYTIQILYDTIETLDPDFDISNRNVYRPPEEYKPADAS